MTQFAREEMESSLGLMAPSHEKGALLYVVSRSGKVLGPGSSACSAFNDNLNGGLEAWVFWNGMPREGTWIRPDVSKTVVRSFQRTTSKEVLGFGREKVSKAFETWGDDVDRICEVILLLLWKQSMSNGRNDAMYGRSQESYNVVGSAEDHLLSGSSKWRRMRRNVKIGLTQMAVLHRWEAQTREPAAKWVAWLLKIVRKTRPHSRGLLHVLFTMSVAVLPVMCHNLMVLSWTGSRDPQQLRCVDIVWNALKRSCACFSPLQWEILDEKLNQCQQLRLKIGASTGAAIQEEGQETRKRAISHNRVKNEKLSNSLVMIEGVRALVERAVNEKMYYPGPRNQWVDGIGEYGSKVSLMCPLSGSRVKVPARGKGCKHHTCFDLQAHLEVQAKNGPGKDAYQLENSATWCCPICGSDTTWPQIVVDKTLLRILEVLPKDMLQVCLLPNGRWRVVWNPDTDNATNVPFNIYETVETKSKYCKNPVQTHVESEKSTSGQELLPDQNLVADEQLLTVSRESGLDLFAKDCMSEQLPVDHSTTVQAQVDPDLMIKSPPSVEKEAIPDLMMKSSFSSVEKEANCSGSNVLGVDNESGRFLSGNVQETQNCGPLLECSARTKSTLYRAKHPGVVHHKSGHRFGAKHPGVVQHKSRRKHMAKRG